MFLSYIVPRASTIDQRDRHRTREPKTRRALGAIFPGLLMEGLHRADDFEGAVQPSGKPLARIGRGSRLAFAFPLRCHTDPSN
jgi:hypothetical protein